MAWLSARSATTATPSMTAKAFRPRQRGIHHVLPPLATRGAQAEIDHCLLTHGTLRRNKR
jgi:hypothetical protein